MLSPNNTRVVNWASLFSLQVTVLVSGHNCGPAAESAAKIKGVSKVRTVFFGLCMLAFIMHACQRESFDPSTHAQVIRFMTCVTTTPILRVQCNPSHNFFFTSLFPRSSRPTHHTWPKTCQRTSKGSYSKSRHVNFPQRNAYQHLLAPFLSIHAKLQLKRTFATVFSRPLKLRDDLYTPQHNGRMLSMGGMFLERHTLVFPVLGPKPEQPNKNPEKPPPSFFLFFFFAKAVHSTCSYSG
jgi:hypothetical protein